MSGLFGRGFLLGSAFFVAVGVAACGTPAQTTAPPAASAPEVAGSQSKPSSPSADLSGQAAPTTQAGVQVATKLNLNTATDEQLLSVPNSGARMLREFKEYRPYTSIEQFRREIGKYVSADQVAAYEQYLFVPVDPNQADAETLQQIPGVDAGEAAQLVAGRPYATTDAFMTKLAPFVTPEQAVAARSYLATP